MLERANVLRVALLVVGLAASARAEGPDFVGRHTLVAREADAPTRTTTVTLVVERDLRVTRHVEGGPTLRGLARLVDGRLEVTLATSAGLTDRLGPEPAREPGQYRAAYRWLGGALVGRGLLPGLASPDVRRRIEERALDAAGPVDAVAPPGVEVVSLAVTNGLPIADAPAPQVTRAPGSTEPASAQPVALPRGERLRVAVRLAARDDRAPTGPVVLEARVGDAIVGGAQVTGRDAELLLTHDLGATLGVRPVDLRWTVDGVPAGRTPLRVYVTLAAPVKSSHDVRLTKVRLENAARWAEGTSRLVASGSASIPDRVNDRMRHFVHPADLRSPPAVADYAPDARRPLNYALLPGAIGPDGRALAQVLYPPCGAVDPLLLFENYRSNYGWYVLENPGFPGGRCNQQAELLVDVLATLGVESKVRTIERVGRGRRTGRPVRQYFRAPESGPWNFHAVTEVTLEDGATWTYDHSFSPVPGHRSTGSPAQVERTGGPFVRAWDRWYYDDMGGFVPRDDLPLEWRGVPTTSEELGALASLQGEARVAAQQWSAILEHARQDELGGRTADALEGYASVVHGWPAHPTARAHFGRAALAEARRLLREGKAAWYGLNDDEEKFRQALELIDRHRRLRGPASAVDEELRALSATLTAEL